MHYESTILFLFTSGNILCESIRVLLHHYQMRYEPAIINYKGKVIG
jgi:hypothetical protein